MLSILVGASFSIEEVAAAGVASWATHRSTSSSTLCLTALTLTLRVSPQNYYGMSVHQIIMSVHQIINDVVDDYYEEEEDYYEEKDDYYEDENVHEYYERWFRQVMPFCNCSSKFVPHH